MGKTATVIQNGLEGVNFNNTKIAKVHQKDRGMLFLAIGFIWLTIIAVCSAILKVAPGLEGGSNGGIVAVSAGILVAILCTVALLAVEKHLRKNKEIIYSEDQKYSEMTRSQGNKQKLIKTFDVLFVLILCYITLLVPILMQGKVLVGGAGQEGIVYTIQPQSFVPCLLLLFVYGFFLLKHSQKELKILIQNMYGKREK